MTDLWSFLLQTLTASGVAALLLAVKAMFRDKLSPRWQFGIWGVLALVLLLPAGWGGRYVLANWPMWVEALKSALTGQFGTLTRVIAPVPLPRLAPPRTAADWLYLLYLAGAAALLARYLISYARLRRALKRGRPGQNERVRAVAERYGLPACPAVEVDGLPTAFICGVFKPVLALPAGVETDEKVILHELLHLKYKDVLWGWLIALLRCLHWCNPLLWLCADRAGNDLEALCDQRVLERLEGEERRDYGRILLSMADEKYARTPGTSSAANGGKNIARRIQDIARFKRYPAGMALVSVCVALVLGVPLVVGAWAQADWPVVNSTDLLMAYARTTRCSTYAGAFDTYAKAVMAQRFDYRAMCAPLSEQDALAAEGWRWREELQGDWDWHYPDWRNGIDIGRGYQLYNLAPVGEDAWEGVLVFQLYEPPENVEWDSLESHRWLTLQKLRAEKEGERWVVIPQEAPWAVQGDQRVSGNFAVPAWVYEAQYGDFTLRIQWQTVSAVDSYTQSGDEFWSAPVYSTSAVPDGKFDRVEASYAVYALYTGDPEKKDEYSHIRVRYTPVYKEAAGPQRHSPEGSGVIQMDGRWEDRDLKEYWSEPRDSWELIFLNGGGYGYQGSEAAAYQLPDAYEMELYLNGEFAAELELNRDIVAEPEFLPAGGGEWFGR